MSGVVIAVFPREMVELLWIREAEVCACVGCTVVLWLIILTNYKDIYTVIICIQCVVTLVWNNYQSHLQGSSSLRNVGIYQSILRYMPEEGKSHLQCCRILKS